MSTETSLQKPEILEQLILQVRGINAVRLVADQRGQIDEVHVVGTPARSAKSIVRDIESILYVRGGVRVDHRKISLVQIAETAAESLSSRLRLMAVSQNTGDEFTSVTVSLRLREHEVQGVGRSRPGQEPDLPQLAAYATIHGLISIFGPQGQVQLEGLQRQPFGALEVYLAHLSRDEDGVPEALVGVSVLRHDELAAVARAVLDAMNRRLERLLAPAAASAAPRASFIKL